MNVNPVVLPLSVLIARRYNFDVDNFILLALPASEMHFHDSVITPDLITFELPGRVHVSGA